MTTSSLQGFTNLHDAAYDHAIPIPEAATMIVSEHTFQSTDLARSAAKVMAAARTHLGALIRDKDGRTYALTAAAPIAAMQYALDGLSDAVVLQELLKSEGPRRPTQYGKFAWLTSLPDEGQHEFLNEYIPALLQVRVTGIEPVEDLLYSWQQTARIHEDPALLAELSTPIDEPLGTVVT